MFAFVQLPNMVYGPPGTTFRRLLSLRNHPNRARDKGQLATDFVHVQGGGQGTDELI